MNLDLYGYLKGMKEMEEKRRDLISREALLKEVESRIMWSMAYNAIYEAIRIAPAVDAVEVVHAKWEEYENSIWDEAFYRCSACEEDFCFIEGTPADNLYKYCPNCGARMDGE